MKTPGLDEIPLEESPDENSNISMFKKIHTNKQNLSTGQCMQSRKIKGLYPMRQTETD